MAPEKQPTREKPKRVRGLAAHPREHMKPLFLSAYPECGTIQSTCVKLGISRELVYRWLEGAEFQAAFAAADKQLLEVYENSAQFRGVRGITRYVIQKGAMVVDERHVCVMQNKDPKTCANHFLSYQEYSDNCLAMLMAAKDPERYGRHSKTEIKIDVHLINQVASEILNSLRRNVPDACPHCKTLLDITPKVASDLERISKKFEVTAA